AARGGVVEAPQSAVVAVKQPAGGVEADGVVVGVGAVAVGAPEDVGPALPAVAALDEAAGVEGAAGVNDVGVGRVDGQGGVVIALAGFGGGGQVVRGIGERQPVGAAVGGFQHPGQASRSRVGDGGVQGQVGGRGQGQANGAVGRAQGEVA